MQIMGYLYVHCVSESSPFYFWDNFTNCKPIQLIFRTNIAGKICNKLTMAIFSIFTRFWYVII